MYRVADLTAKTVKKERSNKKKKRRRLIARKKKRETKHHGENRTHIIHTSYVLYFVFPRSARTLAVGSP